MQLLDDLNVDFVDSIKIGISKFKIIFDPPDEGVQSIQAYEKHIRLTYQNRLNLQFSIQMLKRQKYTYIVTYYFEHYE